MVTEMPGGDVDDVQPSAGCADRGLGIGALVVARELGEAPVKAVADAVLDLAGEDRDQARIEPARNIGANRHVAAQVQPDRIVEQIDEAVFEIPRAMIVIDFVTDIPITPDAYPAVLDGQRVPGQ